MTFFGSAPGTAYAASSVTGSGDMSVRNRRNDITITCPDRITYQIQPIAAWNAGMHGIKVLQFKDATVNGRILYCNYSASNGDSSTLLRDMPAGYVCTTDSRPNFKNWGFVCKRPVPPIKIKPKSD
jgi:hypothetical protein